MMMMMMMMMTMLMMYLSDAEAGASSVTGALYDVCVCQLLKQVLVV